MVTPLPVTTPLEVIGGKYVKIESRTSGTDLVVRPRQRHAPNCIVYHVPDSQDGGVNVAFGFKLKENMYYPVVELDPATKKASIKVVRPRNQPISHFSTKYLFRWVTNGQYGSLHSVAVCSQYLSVSGHNVILSSKRDPSFRITLDTRERSIASRFLHPLNPFFSGLGVGQNWPLVAYSECSTSDDDSDMKKDREIPALLW